jgi:hypothetical protein
MSSGWVAVALLSGILAFYMGYNTALNRIVLALLSPLVVT